jgi:hypothetical protein
MFFTSFATGQALYSRRSLPIHQNLVKNLVKTCRLPLDFLSAAMTLVIRRPHHKQDLGDYHKMCQGLIDFLLFSPHFWPFQKVWKTNPFFHFRRWTQNTGLGRPARLMEAVHIFKARAGHFCRTHFPLCSSGRFGFWRIPFQLLRPELCNYHIPPKCPMFANHILPSAFHWYDWFVLISQIQLRKPDFGPFSLSFGPLGHGRIHSFQKVLPWSCRANRPWRIVWYVCLTSKPPLHLLRLDSQYLIFRSSSEFPSFDSHRFARLPQGDLSNQT